MRKSPWEKEWEGLLRAEERFAKRAREGEAFFLNQKLAPMVPQKLAGTLEAAFCKAFELIFQKGTPLIEKTYSKEKREKDFKLASYAVELMGDRKSLRSVSKKAGSRSAGNLLLSGIEGAGLGVLGIGIPDIPLFTAMILKSIYEVALGFGYPYDTPEEKRFILALIRASLSKGGEFTREDGQVNSWLAGCQTLAEEKLQIKQTSDALSRALLYMKFLQGIPIAGIIGGLSDTVYLRRITAYATLKYKRRFLLDHKKAP